MHTHRVCGVNRQRAETSRQSDGSLETMNNPRFFLFFFSVHNMAQHSGDQRYESLHLNGSMTHKLSVGDRMKQAFS